MAVLPADVLGALDVLFCIFVSAADAVDLEDFCVDFVVVRAEDAGVFFVFDSSEAFDFTGLSDAVPDAAPDALDAVVARVLVLGAAVFRVASAFEEAGLDEAVDDDEVFVFGAVLFFTTVVAADFFFGVVLRFTVAVLVVERVVFAGFFVEEVVFALVFVRVFDVGAASWGVSVSGATGCAGSARCPADDRWLDVVSCDGGVVSRP